MKIEKFPLSVIEQISKILGDTNDGLTGTEIKRLLQEANIADLQPEITKWQRLFAALKAKQNQDQCANNICAFITLAMLPSRHCSDPNKFDFWKFEMDKILSFQGLAIREDGQLYAIPKASTLGEARARASNLMEKLISRNVHSDVLQFCREELLVNNYFHAVFEATKSVAEKVRVKTGLTGDGVSLIDEAFSFNGCIPYLALSSLETESQKSEQRGFVNLLKGLFGTFRNTTAHAPKITWTVEEQDALDILSLVSLVHRRLDKSIRARSLYDNLQ